MSQRASEIKSEQSIRLWSIENKELHEVQKATIPFEKNLEEWLEKDISMISDDLLVIGRQVPTRYGGLIDLLGIDSQGNIVIIELKRDKTSRDITSQVIDYASWVKEIDSDALYEIARDYLDSKHPDKTFDEVFKDKFQIDFPEEINNDHKMIVVGSNIDSSTLRIIQYLSERGIGINAFTFNYFNEDSHSFLASTYLIEPSKAEASRIKKRQVVGVWTDTIEEIAKRFQEQIPDARFSKTVVSWKAIFTDFSRIHFEYNILGKQNKKSIYTSLHIEREDRNENLRIFNELLPYVEDYNKQQLGEQLQAGPWNPSNPDHRWRSITRSKEFGEAISENDIEWAVDSLVDLYKYFTPILSKIQG